MNAEKKVQNMRQVLEMLEKQLSGKRLIRYMVNTEVIEVSSEQFFTQVRERACAFKTRGLAGKHIGIMGSNSCEWLVHFCAVLFAGAVAVLLDRESNPETIAALAKKTALDAVLYDASTEKAVLDAALPSAVQRISMQEPDECSSLHGEKAVPFETERKPEDLACILFTSGTTSGSKAVMLSERALVASVCSEINDKKFQALLAVMPFHHLAGFVTILNAMYLGAEICLAQDLKYFYRYLECMKPDYVSVVPSMLQMLARKLKNGGANGSLLGWNLRIINCGGAAFCPELLQMLLERQITVLQGYGASEAGGIGLLWEMTPERPDTIGKPPAELEVKIINDELFLRSESVMMGYYGDKEGSEKVLCDGWYATGDLCRQDEDGYLYLIGRRKNLIILSNGENVSPEEMEEKLYACKEISEIMVGVEQNLITATVFPNFAAHSGKEDKEIIQSRIQEAIARYNAEVPVCKQVQRIHFLEQPFAKTATGKLIRGSVRKGEV